jgi:hypothetical protein
MPFPKFVLTVIWHKNRGLNFSMDVVDQKFIIKSGSWQLVHHNANHRCWNVRRVLEHITLLVSCLTSACCHFQVTVTSHYNADMTQELGNLRDFGEVVGVLFLFSVELEMTWGIPLVIKKVVIGGLNKSSYENALINFLEQ